MEHGSGPRETVDAVERAFSVIRALRELNGAGVTDLSNELGMSKSGVHKQLATLVSEGYVTKRDGEYRLSFKFITESEYVKNNSPFYNVAADEIDDLAAKSGDFAYLTVLEHDEAHCVYTAKGENAVATDAQVGNRVPLHSSAAGKAILSELSENRRERILSQPLPATTQFTITDEADLADELERVRQDGVAFEDEENVRGMRGVGVPIPSASETMVAAVAVSGPLSLLTDDRFREELPELVQQTKNFIEVKFSLESRDPVQEGSHVPKDFY